MACLPIKYLRQSLCAAYFCGTAPEGRGGTKPLASIKEACVASVCRQEFEDFGGGLPCARLEVLTDS